MAMAPHRQMAGGGLVSLAKQLTTGSTAILNNITSMNGVPFQTRDHFINLLSEWETYLPMNQLWMVVFDIPKLVTEKEFKRWGEHHMNHDWGIDAVTKRVGKHFVMKQQGCCLAQTVNIPTELSTVKTVGPSNRGFLKGPIMDHRNDFAPVTIEFLETTLSFVDFVIRPWIILAQHRGLVAREGVGELNLDEKITTDIFVVNFMRAGTNFLDKPDTHWHENQQGFLPRKMWLFKDALPINADVQRYSYTPAGNIDRRNIEWSFRKYQVMNLPGAISKMDQIRDADNGSAPGSRKPGSIPRWNGRKEIYPWDAKGKQSRVRTDMPPYDSTITKVRDYNVWSPTSQPKPKPSANVFIPAKGELGGINDIMVQEKYPEGITAKDRLASRKEGDQFPVYYHASKFSRIRTNVNPPYSADLKNPKLTSQQRIHSARGIKDILVKENYPEGKLKSGYSQNTPEHMKEREGSEKGPSKLSRVRVQLDSPYSSDLTQGTFPEGAGFDKIIVKEKFPPGYKVDDPERPWTKKYNTNVSQGRSYSK